MQLTLSVLRCPPAVVPETRTLTGGEFSVGRGPGVDWVLSDVNQMVSRRHCTLAFHAGEWQIMDNSANGTFANNDNEPIGKNNMRILRDHDRLRIGPYEIEVLLNQDTRSGSYQNARPRDYQDAPSHDYQDAPTHDSRRSLSAGRPGLQPDDPFSDPLWPDDPGTPFLGRTQDDHSSVLDDAMHPPSPVGQMSIRSGGTIPPDDLLPEGWDHDLLPSASGQGPAGLEVVPSGSGLPPQRTGAQQSPSLPPASPPAGDAALLAAFLAGAGLPEASLGDPVSTMQRLGETFRALVSGLRAALIARASIKSEFRIEQTMIRARNNNPLKFSANDDDAVSALLNVGRPTDMAPARAVSDALRDIRLHELATMAAMQSAVRALMQRLDPEKLMASLGPGARSMLPGHKKVRAWDAYEGLHVRITQALSDDFDSVFGKAFARAYEEALEELLARDRSGGRRP